MGLAQVCSCTRYHQGGCPTLRAFRSVGIGGGFYKRGCQVKNTTPFGRERVRFLGIQPLLVAATAVHQVVRVATQVLINSDVRSVFFCAPTSSSVAAWPTMVLSEARVWRGTIALLGCPREHTVAHETHFAYPAQDTFPRTRARSPATFERQRYLTRLLLSCALTLLVSSDVGPRTSLLSSTGSEQSRPSCGPASAVPSLAVSRGQLSLHRTGGTDPASCWPRWRRS
jgi:hypothetical protein